MGLGPIENELVYSYVGNGAPVLMRRSLGPEASDADVQRALDFFIRYYAQHCLDNTVLYPGVKNTLDELREGPATLAVLTNKPVRISNQILRGLALGEHFFRVYGGNSFSQKKPDPIGVTTLLAETGAPRERTMVIGDSAVDVRTARNAQVRACGVLYGFQPDTFATDPPDVLIGDMAQLPSVL